MPIDDFLDPAQESRRLKKAQQRAWVSGGRGGGDGDHTGSGTESLQIGASADASGGRSVSLGFEANSLGVGAVAIGESTEAWARAVAIGRFAVAAGDRAIAIGENAAVSGGGGVAIGNSASAGADQISLGYGAHRVLIKGVLNLKPGSGTVAVVPTSSASTAGSEGDVTYDANYIYVKTSAGWRRSALSTF